MNWFRASLIILALIVFAAFMIRLSSPAELDDLHPDIPCDADLIKRSDVLWVIPLYQNHSITENQSWIWSINNSGKTIGLHGVYHTYHEFEQIRDNSYLEQGVTVFNQSFGYEPKIFKAPYLAISEENIGLVENHGMKVRGHWNQISRKVYHCSDTGRFPNWLIKIF